MKKLNTVSIKSCAILLVLGFVSLILLLMASLQLEALRHKRMQAQINTLLVEQSLDLRLTEPGPLGFVRSARPFRLDRDPSTYRYVLEKNAGIAWVFSLEAGGIRAVFLMQEHPDGSFSPSIPLGPVSKNQLRFLPSGLVRAKEAQIARLAGGYRED